VGVLTFGFGVWFHRLSTRLAVLQGNITPLVVIHKEELIRYYLEKGILPNPSLTPRRQYLIDKLRAGTISYDESKELADALRVEERKAKEEGNNDAVVAILGLLALVIILAALSKK